MLETTKQQLLEMLERHEGYRAQPYICSEGATTIGIGRNLDVNGISRDEALYMLNNDVCQVETDIRRAWAHFDDLSETRKIVILNMCFQMGVAGVMEFTRMLNALEVGDFALAGDEMLDSRWRDQTQGRAFELAQIMVRDRI